MANLSISGKQLLSSLLNRVLFLTLFSCILAYMVESNIVEKFGDYAFSESPIITAINVGAWVLSTFVIYGMVVSVLGKMFSVVEKPVAIVTNTFWGQFYGILLGSFVGILIVIISLNFVSSATTLASLSFLLPPIVAFFTIKATYGYYAIKISMQTTVGETIFLLTLTHILNAIIYTCLLGLIAMVF